MKDKENQSQFDFDGESAEKLREVFGVKQNKKTDYEVFKEWHDQWMKEKKENKPPE